MRVLFLHDNFPGQFKDIAPALAADPANDVVFATLRGARQLPGIRKVSWSTARRGGEHCHRYLRELERAVLAGQGVYRMAKQLEAEGWVPDLVYGHSGWGSTMYVKDAFPHAKLVSYLDWFYRPRGSNGDFFPERPMSTDRACLFRARNGAILLDLAHADWGVVTTEWQLGQFPRDYYGKLSLLHDGIDTDWFSPATTEGFVHGRLDLRGAPELVTFATRGLEPYRGFDVFLRAVELLQRRRPQLQVAVVGDDRIVYGSKPPEGDSWKSYLLGRLDLDHRRLHFTGRIPPPALRELMRASHAHFYASAPFIPSWSLFEAMSTGCLVVGSATPPVEEVLQDGRNGLLYPFFDHEALADRLEEAIVHQARLQPLREAARATIVDRYALSDLLPRQLRLLDDVVAGKGAQEVEASVAGRLEPPGSRTAPVGHREQAA